MRLLDRLRRKDKDDEGVLICGSSSSITGCAERACASCGETIYVAPSGQQVLRENPDITPICMTCGRREMEKVKQSKEGLQIDPLSEQTRSELIEHGVSNEEIEDICRRLGIPLPEDEW